MLIWLFASTTALLWLIKRELRQTNYEGGQRAQFILRNYVISMLFLTIFTVGACIVSMVRLNNNYSYIAAAAESVLIIWQISIVLYFDTFRAVLKKRTLPGQDHNLPSYDNAMKKTPAIVCSQIQGHDNGTKADSDVLPSYEDVVKKFDKPTFME
uniref:DUF5671 domain-containing protein n=1 Tax=Steinernema glaseri TaxID=37863 RepID=A0A1I7YCQ3_9BILA